MAKRLVIVESPAKAKTLARFKQLDERPFAEKYLVGTLASVTVAVASALAARVALGGL